MRLATGAVKSKSDKAREQLSKARPAAPRPCLRREPTRIAFDVTRQRGRRRCLPQSSWYSRLLAFLTDAHLHTRACFGHGCGIWLINNLERDRHPCRP